LYTLHALAQQLQAQLGCLLYTKNSMVHMIWPRMHHCSAACTPVSRHTSGAPRISWPLHAQRSRSTR
jgi:hypothetical protein